MYAELMGNHKSHRIKSRWDNIIARQDVPMCNFLLLESDLVPRQLDCDCEQNAKPGQLGTEKD